MRKTIAKAFGLDDATRLQRKRRLRDFAIALIRSGGFLDIPFSFCHTGRPNGGLTSGICHRGVSGKITVGAKREMRVSKMWST
jgi:hypothetical protein